MSEREPFVAVPVWVMLHRELSADAKVAYGWFTEKTFRLRSDTLRITQRQLCLELGVTKPTLLRRMAELEAVGAVTVERGWSDQHNVKAVNIYTVHQRPFGEEEGSEAYERHAAPYARRCRTAAVACQTPSTTPSGGITTPTGKANTTPPVLGQDPVTRGSNAGLTEKKKKVHHLEGAFALFSTGHTREENRVLAASQLAEGPPSEREHDQPALASVTALPLTGVSEPGNGRHRRPADDFFDLVCKHLSNAANPAMAAKVANAALSAGIDPSQFERLCRILRGLSAKAATAPNMLKVLADPNHEARLKLDEIGGHLDEARELVLSLRDRPDCHLGADPFAAQVTFAELLARRWSASEIVDAAADTSTWTVAALGVTRDRLRKASGPKPWEATQPRPSYHRPIEDRPALWEPTDEEKERVLAQMEADQAALKSRRRAG